MNTLSSSQRFPADGAFHFGQLVMVQRLSGAQTSSNVLTLPIAVAAVPPIVSVPTAVSASVVAGNSGLTSFDVRNVGRAPLDYAITPSGSGSSTLYMYERSPQSTTFSSTLSQRSNDTFITGKVRASLVDAQDISANSFKVVTERNVVYLMGRVSQREANRATEIARGVSGVSKVVRVFEIVSEEELRRIAPQPAPVTTDDTKPSGG